MSRRALIALLVLATVFDRVGIALTGAFDARTAVFGWTAYSPLSATAYSGSYAPTDTTWLIWAPRIGVALVVIGAGATGAAVAALVLGRRRPGPSGS